MHLVRGVAYDFDYNYHSAQQHRIESVDRNDGTLDHFDFNGKGSVKKIY